MDSVLTSEHISGCLNDMKMYVRKYFGKKSLKLVDIFNHNPATYNYNKRAGREGSGDLSHDFKITWRYGIFYDFYDYTW